jgi:amylosucrase
MLHNMILAAGGIPLLYIGDEIASLNDYSYREDRDKAEDSRWVHRPRFDWERAEQRFDTATIVGRVFQGIKHMIGLRKGTPALSDGTTLFIPTYNDHVIAFLCNREIMVLANFSEKPQTIDQSHLDYYWPLPAHMIDMITGSPVDLSTGLALDSYQYMWLKGE